jgi:hypothetical protein
LFFNLGTHTCGFCSICGFVVEAMGEICLIYNLVWWGGFKKLSQYDLESATPSIISPTFLLRLRDYLLLNLSHCSHHIGLCSFCNSNFCVCQFVFCFSFLPLCLNCSSHSYLNGLVPHFLQVFTYHFPNEDFPGHSIKIVYLHPILPNPPCLWFPLPSCFCNLK